VKLTAAIQLKPTLAQVDVLRSTLERCNDACAHLARRAAETAKTRQFDLHKLAYADIRSRFGLSAQAAVRCIAKVADAYKAGHNGARTFRKHAAQPYDARIFRFVDDNTVSIWTVVGRIKVAFVCGEHQRALLAHRKGEVDLMCVRNRWYIAVTCDVPDAEPININDVLGVDLGIVNIATDSDDTTYTGDAIERVRHRHARRRAGLQRRGSKAAKRRLRKLSGQERRFRTHSNHVISKALVATAQRSGRAIGLEDLTHIRKRVKARRKQRARLHAWAFQQLGQFVAYKAQRAGVPVLIVDPRSTSKGCSECGCIDDRNRPRQATFSCIGCGYATHADRNAARNTRLRARADVNPPLSSRLANPEAGKSHRL
jgi:IS605 OrfB family transposase